MAARIREDLAQCPGVRFVCRNVMAASAYPIAPVDERLVPWARWAATTAGTRALRNSLCQPSRSRSVLTTCQRPRRDRIKEQFSLFADCVSAETIRANQMRLYLSAMAYILVSGLRRVGLRGTELAQAQVSTIRTKLLKIGAQIRVTVRKVRVSMAFGYPWQGLYQQIWTNLRW